MDWTVLALDLASVALAIVTAVLVNRLVATTATAAILVALVVAGSLAALVQYAIGNGQRGGGGSEPVVAALPPRASQSVSPRHHVAGSKASAVGPVTLPSQSTALSATGSVSTGSTVAATPQFLDYTRLATVFAGGSAANFCATVYVPTPSSGLLYFSADFGSFANPQFSARGTSKRCTTYFAPKDDSISSDVITIRIIDLADNRSATVSERVPIPASPTPPP